MKNEKTTNDSSLGPSTNRRTFLGGVGVAGISGILEPTGQQEGVQSTESQDQEQSEENNVPAGRFADRVLINGKIVTLDEHEINDEPGTIAEAAAISNGRFREVGTEGQIKRQIGPQTEVVNLAGKTVLPGFVESHVHPSGTIEDVAPELFEVPGLHLAIMAEQTPEATLNKMRKFLDQVSPQDDEWIFFNVEPNPDIPEVDSIIKLTRWTKRNDPADLKITKEDINDLAPNNPMLAGISGGRTPSIAEPGQIIRLERTSEGDIEKTFIRGEST